MARGDILKVLILGANGLIGSTIFSVLAQESRLDVRGTIRNPDLKRFFPPYVRELLVSNVELSNHDCLLKVVMSFLPNVIINAAGITKHLKQSNDPLQVLPINAILPHRIVQFCEFLEARLIQISSDCVFRGDKGGYTESDFPDAIDLYGRSKALGEINAKEHITIRTSTIGHELNTSYGLLNWFLSQEGSCYGYKNAIFSGVPAVVLAEVIRDYVLPNESLSGLYNLATNPISKYEILQLIARSYGKVIDVRCDTSVKVDRSLDGSRFERDSGFQAPEWPQLIEKMYASR